MSLTASLLRPLLQERVLPSRSSTSQRRRRWSRMGLVKMKTMKKLNKKGLEFNPKIGRFSPKGEYSGGKVKCYNCGEEGHIASKCSKPRKNQDRAKGNGKATTSKKKT